MHGLMILKIIIIGKSSASGCGLRAATRHIAEETPNGWQFREHLEIPEMMIIIQLPD